MRPLIIAFLILFSLESSGRSCSIFERIAEEGLSESSSFWDDYAALADKGDDAVEKLIAKHKNKTAASSLEDHNLTETPRAPAKLRETNNVTVTSRAERSFAQLPENIRQKVDDFVDLWSKEGSASISRLKGPGYSFERLRGTENTFSVRLSNRHRVVFQINGDELRIVDIGSEVYNH